MECNGACNAKRTCWNCPAAVLKGNVDFRACGQSKEKKRKIQESSQTVIECSRRPELGYFEPSITFEQCPQWELNEKYNMYMLKNMKVMVLGIDGSSKNGNDMNATVFPIAFPLIAGPGTLSTIISFRASFSDFEIILGILINALIIYIVLKSADRIKNAIGANGIMIIERFFGIILISIGVKIFLENLIASLNAIG